MLLPLQCLLTLIIRCELAEICCRHSHFVGFPRRLGGSSALCFLLTLKKALFTSSDSISQQSGPRSGIAALAMPPRKLGRDRRG